MLRHIQFSLIIGYGVSAITMTFGLLMLVGFFLPEAVPDNVRITFGIVMILVGIYRFAATRLRSAQTKRDVDAQ